MADRRRVTVPVIVEALEVVDHDHGHWCNTCLLGTGLRAIISVTVNGEATIHTPLWCTECGGRDVTATDEPRHC